MTTVGLQFAGKIADEIADHGGALRFETQPKPPNWSNGPELEVFVSVVKDKAKMVWGFILGLLGLLLIGYGAEEIKSHPLAGVSTLAIGIILGVVSGLLISKKLSLKS